MDTSLFLAKLIGPIFVIVGIGLLLNGDRYRAVVDEVMSSHALLYIFGAIALTGGLAIVLTHNVWVWDWPVIITIVGWLMIVRGSFRIVFPQQVEDLARAGGDAPHPPGHGARPRRRSPRRRRRSAGRPRGCRP